MSYVALKRELSPTAAAVQLYVALPKAINLGQGREIDEPKGALGDLLKADIKSSTKYNAAVGGSMDVRESAAGWITRFIGIPATAANTFVIQQLGREGLGHALKVAALHHAPDAAAIVPDTMWPMVEEKLADERLHPLHYPVTRSGLADSVSKLIAGSKKPVAAAYFNFPHNPTGMHISREENIKLQGVLDAANQKGANIFRIDDIPYFAGCDQSASGAYLNAGYDGVFNENSPTKWAAIFSFSKAFGCANPGLTLLCVHPAIAADVSKRLTRTTGLAYAPEYLDHIAALLRPENDQAILAHFAAMNMKYKENRKILEEAFSNSVVDGDASMTSLIKVPADVFGRNVMCVDGQVRAIKDLNDVVEFLGNEGVITVNNGTDLLRIAQAAHPDDFRKGVSILKAALDKIRDSEKLAA